MSIVYSGFVDEVKRKKDRRDNVVATILVGLIWFGIPAIVIGIVYLNDQRDEGINCIDVTSYDYNWDNDMLCTRPDGSKFYTDYEGARRYQ